MAAPELVGGVTIRPFEKGDEEPLRAAFARTFSAVDAGFSPRTRAEWDWRFHAAPDGARIWLAVDERGDVLAQYATERQRALIEGVPVTFAHVVDSFAVPEARGGLGRRGVFARTALACVAAHGGDGDDEDVFWWGLPVRAAWRIGKELLGYEVVDPDWELVATGPPALGGASADVEIEEALELGDEVDGLFQATAPEHGALLVRDRRRLTWRYLEAPEAPFRIALARRRGALAGLCVLGRPPRRKDDVGVGETWIADWLVRRSDVAAGVALLDWAWHARSEGSRLVATFPASSAEWARLIAAGFEVRAPRRFVAGRSWHRRRGVDWFARQLYRTRGDTDLL